MFSNGFLIQFLLTSALEPEGKFYIQPINRHSNNRRSPWARWKFRNNHCMVRWHKVQLETRARLCGSYTLVQENGTKCGTVPRCLCQANLQISQGTLRAMQHELPPPTTDSCLKRCLCSRFSLVFFEAERFRHSCRTQVCTRWYHVPQ